MKRLPTTALLAAILCGAIVSPRSTAAAPVRERLTGTVTLVSATLESAPARPGLVPESVPVDLVVRESGRTIEMRDKRTGRRYRFPFDGAEARGELGSGVFPVRGVGCPAVSSVVYAPSAERIDLFLVLKATCRGSRTLEARYGGSWERP